MVKPIVIAEPAEASAPLKAWVRNYNLETYRACFLDSCSISQVQLHQNQASERKALLAG